MTLTTPASLHARAAVRRLPTPERTTLRDPRAFWLAQARACLGTAREWRGRFGGPLHDVALGWYLDALLRADRYRRWAHEYAPAVRHVDELLAEVA